MTNTATPTTTDWSQVTFAVLAATPLPSEYTIVYSTTGHSTATCPAIKGRIAATETSLDDFMAANEFFDGEVQYRTPWPCGTCVPVRTGTPATVAFDAPAPTFGTGSGAARPAVEADPSEAEAKAYAASYTGTFAFMVDMRAKAQRAGARFTPNMVAAILKCKAADERRAAAPAPVPAAAPQTDEDARRAALKVNVYGGTCRVCSATVPAETGRRERLATGWTVLHSTTAECTAVVNAPAAAHPAPTAPGFNLRDLPEGARGALHVAVPDHTSGNLVFLKVAARDGKMVVLQEVGGHEDLYLGQQHDGQAYRGKRSAELQAVLADPKAAIVAYGLHFTRCGICGTQLTDTEPGGSVEQGIGPVCAAKAGW